jgi:hypothetical protein
MRKLKKTMSRASRRKVDRMWAAVAEMKVEAVFALDTEEEYANCPGDGHTLLEWGDGWSRLHEANCGTLDRECDKLRHIEDGQAKKHWCLGRKALLKRRPDAVLCRHCTGSEAKWRGFRGFPKKKAR